MMSKFESPPCFVTAPEVKVAMMSDTDTDCLLHREYNCTEAMKHSGTKVCALSWGSATLHLMNVKVFSGWFGNGTLHGCVCPTALPGLAGSPLQLSLVRGLYYAPEAQGVLSKGSFASHPLSVGRVKVGMKGKCLGENKCFFYITFRKCPGHT